MEPMIVAVWHCGRCDVVGWTFPYTDGMRFSFNWCAKARSAVSGGNSYLGVLRSDNAEDIRFPRGTAHLFARVTNGEIPHDFCRTQRS